ncbi:hypothetical protein ACFFQW_17020 [Umezawaea endophytica]|uniref:Uncharacterized protein n=1 Tax=Umezawaea endophytica TaxID=1654476 RepID=A0A9X2VPY4_9PSEU|nr:hypothetical protein [Umezawaea endophytica]MCS7480454.1 hypothetical protein [Umezawaea endophytica]
MNPTEKNDTTPTRGGTSRRAVFSRVAEGVLVGLPCVPLTAVSGTALLVNVAVVLCTIPIGLFLRAKVMRLRGRNPGGVLDGIRTVGSRLLPTAAAVALSRALVDDFPEIPFVMAVVVALLVIFFGQRLSGNVGD